MTHEGPLLCEQPVKKLAQWATSSSRCASIQTSSLQVLREKPNDPFTWTQNIFKSTKWHCRLSLCKGILFPQAESEATKLQERLLREAASFIITHQIPDFVRRSTSYILKSASMHAVKQPTDKDLHVCEQVDWCFHSNEAPLDGASLKQALHQRGINLRYLGHLIKAISQPEHEGSLRHIMVCLTGSLMSQSPWLNYSPDLLWHLFSHCLYQRVAVGEMFIRSSRRVFNSFLQVSRCIHLWISCAFPFFY